MVVRNASPAQHEQLQNKNRDSISSLSDAVICIILSFLPTKYAVGTSILSRRWRYVWTSVPVLDFDDTLVSHPEAAKQSNEQFFMQFVNRVLLLRRDKIKTVRLNVISISDHVTDHANLWICSAMMRNIEELDLDYRAFWLPQVLFSCQTIKILKLRAKIRFKIFGSVSLPRLEVLLIRNVSVANLEKILFGCPVLEELVVCRDYSDYHATTLYVVSSSLKRLTIHQTILEKRGLGIRSVVINAPKLEFFELEDHFSAFFTMIKVSSPLKAAIDVRSSYTNHALRLLRRITNVTVLNLSAYTLEALFKASDDKFPWFRFLTQLEMGAFGNGWLMLPKILKWSPNLEAFTLYKTNDTVPHESIFNEESVLGCLLSSLKSIELKGFGGNTAEMEVLEYFLKNASVLKTFKILISDTSFQKEAEILRMLITFPRASTTCRILLT